MDISLAWHLLIQERTYGNMFLTTDNRAKIDVMEGPPQLDGQKASVS